MTAPILACYSDVTTLKAQLGMAGTTDDGKLFASLQAASRSVDELCGRHFYPLTDARIFTPTDPYKLRVGDFVAASAVAVDFNADRTFEVTLNAARDYYLTPTNAPSARLPYSRIEIDKFNGAYTFPMWPQAVQVTGQWGYSQYTETPGVALNAAITNTTGTSWALTSGGGALVGVGQTLLIDSEALTITAISSDTLTVQRGALGTTAATHLIGAAVSRYVYPPQITRAAEVLAARLFKRKDAAFGILAGGDFAEAIRIGRQDPDLATLLPPFMLRTVA